MKKQWLLGLLLAGFIGFQSCKKDPKIEGQHAEVSIQDYDKNHEWLKDAIIYEVNVRNYSSDGNFQAVTKDLNRIKQMGVEIVWLMPIHPISVKNRKESADDLGSPYAVADYKKVNPDYGTMDDFKALVNKAHELDLKLIIDWVPNHTGWDNVWITEHPDWYTKDSLGNITDPIDYNTGKKWGWDDVADLDYDNEEMRAEMINSLEFWVKEADVDGFRFDVAHGVPVDFWDEVSKDLRALKPSIFLLAEAEGDRDGDVSNFDMTYAWTMHHVLNNVAAGTADADSIDIQLKKDEEIFGRRHIKMMFTTNHDENSWNGTVFERMGKLHENMAVLCWTLEGMPLIYNGQEASLNKRIKFFVQDPIDWGTYDLQGFYTKLGNLKKENEALYNSIYGGSYERVPYEDKRVYAYKRSKGTNEVYVILNFDHVAKDIHLPTAGYQEYISKDAKTGTESITLGAEGYWVGTKK